jgi:ketosteroid isomerase-like protein
MAFDIHAYVADFNKGDDAACVALHYTEDTVIEGPDRTMHGRQEWIDMLQFVHQGISEKLTPLAYAQSGDVLLSEMQVEFTATQDCPDFMHGPLKKGEKMTSRFFASYKLRGDQISRLALAWWPAS